MEALRRGASELCHEERPRFRWCLVELSVWAGGGLYRWIFQVDRKVKIFFFRFFRLRPFLGGLNK